MKLLNTTKAMPSFGLLLVRITLILVCLSSFGYTYGQNNLKGHLKIEDSEDCVFAKVELRKVSDSLLLSYVFSDSVGRFQFVLDFEPTDVFLSISQAEVRDTTIQITQQVGSGSIDLGVLNLQSNASELEGVDVIARVPLIQKKIDRLVFNVESTSNATGKNVLELLSRTPLVFVQNRSISVVGKSGVAILINERRIYLEGDDLAQYLESIPSEEVVRIEVLTNPPSKYDASGSAIINIELKKNRMLGTNGSVTSSYTQAYYGFERLSLILNHREKKVNVYGTFSGRNGENRFDEKTDYTFSTFLNKQRDVTNLYTKGIRGTVGVDYYPSDKSNFSFSWEGSGASRKSNITANSTFDQAGITDSLSNTNKRNDANTFFQSVNANWHYLIDSSGQSINLVANYFYNKTNLQNDFDFQNFSGDTINSVETLDSRSNQLINLGVIDFEHKIPAKFGEFSYGAKFNWISNDNDNYLSLARNNIVISDTLQNSRFLYTEHTEALYSNFHKAWKKTELQVGLRGEYTQLIGKQDALNSQTKRTFLNLFPTLYFLHKFSEKHSISASYGRRIDRPGFSALNPFRTYVTNRIYNIGNPQLRPTYITDGEIGYTLKDRYYFGLMYTGFSNSYMEAPVSEASNIVYTQQNIGNTNQYGGFANVSFNIGDKIENSLVAIYLFSDFKPNVAYYKHSTANILFCSFNSSLSLAKSLSADVNFSARPLGSIYTISNQRAQYILGFGFTQKLLNGQLILSLNVSDVFKNAAPKATVETSAFSLYSRNYYDSRNIVFSASYKFGNKYIRQRRQNAGGEDERNRI